MTTTYTWKINSLKTKTEGANPSAVVQVYWQKTGTDGYHEGSFSGATPFTSTNMPEGTIFIPFEQLTEAMVLQWVQDTVTSNPTYETHINKKIAEDMDSKHAPVTETSMPWAPPAQVTP